MRYELYHYCIEEGHNIPDMTCLQSANLRYRGAVPLLHSRTGQGARITVWVCGHLRATLDGSTSILACSNTVAGSGILLSTWNKVVPPRALSALEESQEGSRTLPQHGSTWDFGPLRHARPEASPTLQVTDPARSFSASVPILRSGKLGRPRAWMTRGTCWVITGLDFPPPLHWASHICPVPASLLPLQAPFRAPFHSSSTAFIY